MRYVLDACVLVPAVCREALLAVAAAGLFKPRWSARILGEWAHAAARHGLDPGPDIARATARFPAALTAPAPGIEARLWLPDAGDLHVLATAVAASADGIVTWNAQDFPRGVLAAEGLTRRDPDSLLWELWSHHPEAVAAALEAVRAEAEARDRTPVALRPLLKRARLTRLARAMG